MLCLSGFELYSLWMPLVYSHSTAPGRGDDEADYFSRNFVCILRTTTTRLMESFIDFCVHFLGNFQT